MFRGRFFGFLFVLLLAVGLLGLAGSSIYRAGWTQGYFVGKVADGGASGETIVIAPDSAPHAGRGWSPLGSFFGTVVQCLLGLFLFGLFFRFIGFLFWRGRGRWDKGWYKHGQHGRWHGKGRWGKHYGGAPPWYDEDADEPMKA
ncbi:MAG: hypothetical protein PVH65_09150 [Chloroflexota bacterium]|jgi:hypothetical protein